MDRSRETWVDGRMPPTVLVTGVGRGHDLAVGAIADRGAVPLGSLLGVDGDRLTLADNAETILSAADTLYDEFVAAADEHLRTQGIDVPELGPRPRLRTPVSARTTLSLADVRHHLRGVGHGLRLRLRLAPRPLPRCRRRTGADAWCDRRTRAVLLGPALDAHVQVRDVHGPR